MLVRLIDVTVEQWLDPKYENHETMDKKFKNDVIGTWLIRSYKQQFNDYVEIRRKNDMFEHDTDMKYDLFDVDVVEWIASEFSNHSMMDLYTKNALWMYWIRRDDEEVLANKELFDLEETYVNEEDEIAEILRIKTNIFNFETPLSKAFDEFNYLLNIDKDLLTHDIPRFKTYEEYKNAWIHEWNEDVPWVLEEPWSKNEVPYEIVDHHSLSSNYQICVCYLPYLSLG
ncbi:hypothetical protein Tco_1137364 [Tanacetum coccineum]